MSITTTDIRNVITKEDDFGHEMRVGHVIANHPMIKVQHGGTYTDSVTQKPRQFDYRCWIRKENACLALAVECKNLGSSLPLVVCGRRRPEDEAFHDLIESRQGTFKRHSATFAGLSSVEKIGNKVLRHFSGNSPRFCWGFHTVFSEIFIANQV